MRRPGTKRFASTSEAYSLSLAEADLAELELERVRLVRPERVEPAIDHHAVAQVEVDRAERVATAKLPTS